ncbi:MAG TPA: phosphoribosylformylglycinamidine synthase subunit PurL [Candidatus Cloacimonadota bacterium]|nr:phosphoribosylformylglycinamidine synthase subunit PurL [Candidatus Cloacimonadota bacterium]
MQEPVVDLKLALEHGLTEEEYNLVLKTIGRSPSFTELGIISVMWSEHASYKNSIKYLKTLPKDGPFMLSKAGEENAGVVDIGDNLAVSFKIESHNHPSAVEPYHGAATGVGGILRDIFTMGARPVCALNSLRFGNPEDPQVKHLIKGVVEGIADYGNCFGVPTVGGEVYFEDAYSGNPLVNAMAVGILEHNNLMSAAAKGPGNFVVYVGAKTGRDGIHGATFASTDLTQESEEKRTAVQVGDPFMEKLLLEATLEVIQKKLVVGIQDMGAAGLTCSSSEMSAKAETGIELDVSLVPQRETGMTAYEIMLSESQERMLMIVEPHNYDEVRAVFEKWDLHAEKIGLVTEDGLLRIKQNGELKAELPSQMLVLGGDAPVYSREYQKPDYIDAIHQLDINELKEPENFNEVLLKLASCPNIASKKKIYQQYDHMVQINTMIEPGGDAAVIRIKDTNKAIAVATDCNARLCYLNPYEGTKAAVAESARNVVCTGAKPVAITNCLNFGNPYKPEVYWTFVEAIRGMADACRKFETPVTGGNVSFYNENPSGAIYPTPTIGMLGLVDDNQKIVTSHFKNEGDLIYLLGDHCHEVGGSQYLKEIHGMIKGDAPILDLDKEALLYQTTLKLISESLLQSAHDCSDGGLAIAIMESCFNPSGKNTGCSVSLPLEYRKDIELFGESHSRIVVSVKSENKDRFETICSENNQKFLKLGVVKAEKIEMNDLIQLNTQDCAKAYFCGLEL